MRFRISSPTSMTSSLVSVVLLLTLISIGTVSGARKRCFVCRSRGPLGDCKDDFAFNVTTASAYGSAAVEIQPCASGWCGKVIEDEDEGAHIIATERMCLTRPPSDGQERCSKTMYANRRNKQFFMCFCKGDLCNHAPLSPHSLSTTTTLIISILVASPLIALISTGNCFWL